MYGFGQVSGRETAAVGGVGGLRTAARVLSAGDPIAILPEGTASRSLIEARPGVGAALAWLSQGRVPIIAAGLHEPDGVLTACFGPPFVLERVGGDRLAEDQHLRATVMAEIARLLPEAMRGHYLAR
jgi:hypothetical protein